MADIRRPSGRQGAAPSGTSGRGAATSSSGRGAPPASNPQIVPAPARTSGRGPAAAPAPAPASNSGRMPATPPASTSGRMQATPAGSGRMPAPKPSGAPIPAAQPSGRMGAAKSNQRMPAGRSGRSGGGGNERSARSKGGKKGGVGGPELMIAGGVLVILLVAVIAFYFMRTGEQANATRAKEEMESTEKENWRLAKEKADDADQVGRLWCQGDESITDDSLKSKFAGDPKIYNVIFSRKKKDKRGKEDEKTVYVNDGHMGPIGSLNRTSDEFKELHMEYAFAEGRSVELVKAVRAILPKDGDPINQGGSITVLVLAKHDAHFEKAKNPPKKEEKKEEKPADK